MCVCLTVFQLKTSKTNSCSYKFINYINGGGNKFPFSASMFCHIHFSLNKALLPIRLNMCTDNFGINFQNELTDLKKKHYPKLNLFMP